MAAGDMRYYKTFYGVLIDDWDFTFGNFAAHHQILIEEYINEGCDTTEYSRASDTNYFIYCEHIKKIFFIEGTIFGQLTIAASEATSHVTSYCVTVGVTNDQTKAERPLFTTGWRSYNKTLAYDHVYDIGEEKVIYYRIDAWNKEEIGEYDRIFVKVEFVCDDNLILYHSNDSTWEDFKIDIPFVLGTK
jgi:hypothetical protein